MYQFFCRVKDVRPIARQGALFFLFIGAALVVDDLQSGFIDDGNAFFFGDGDHLRERGFQEHARDLGKFCARFAREFDVGIGAFGGVDDGIDVAFFRKAEVW